MTTIKAPGISKETGYLLMAVAVAGAAFFVFSKGIKGTTKAIASSAVNAVGGFVEGGVKSVGEIVGIPDTNQSQCEKDIAAGRTWDSSFSCPATTWLKSLVGIKPDGTVPSDQTASANGFMDSTL